MFESWKAAAQVWLVAAFVVLSGCVSSRAFVPTEHVTALSPRGGLLAAEYSLMERGQSVGDVRVWSSGAVRNGADDDPRTTVSIGFELSSHGAAPLRLDAKRLFLEELTGDGDARGRLAPAHVDGELVVAPGESRQVNVSFALPSSVWPNDVPGYRVAWTVVGERAHSRRTPFSRAPQPRNVDPWYPYYAPYYGYYYPGFYGSWSYRFRGWPPPWRGRYYYVPR